MDEDARHEYFNKIDKKYQDKVQNNFIEAGWADVIAMDAIDNFLDIVKDEMNVDVFFATIKARSGRSVPIPVKLWKHINEYLRTFNNDTVRHILGGITTEPLDNTMLLLVKRNEKHELEEKGQENTVPAKNRQSTW